jgi:CTP:molybdopterin cytidylyltransferase MocA
MTSESRPKQRTVVIVQARMGSTRLPGKVLKELSGRPMLTHLLQRLGECRNVDDVWVATTWAPDDDAIVTTAAEAGAGVWRGPEEDTLSRYLGAAEAAGADVVVRVTGDCPLIEPGVIDAAVALRREEHVDYVSAGSSSKLPRGLDCEVFTRTALATAATVDLDPASASTSPWPSSTGRSCSTRCCGPPRPSSSARTGGSASTSPPTSSWSRRSTSGSGTRTRSSGSSRSRRCWRRSPS